MLTAVIPFNGGIGTGWGVLIWLPSWTVVSVLLVVELGGVFRFSCELGTVACKFAALNRGGAVLELSPSLV